ncbi:tetratricopeptide repeat protein [Rhodanobacter glycinis]|uniref:Tetratricopeptide repeat protein n=1 Tax=Rhodanobacter glycinis TaxID=582702 RepID=A0A5B9DZ33_9GAMM|nr:tetratricopeptide repeat protein [Rhodanobacter glycinis]QEE23831.1 tetratricopeptide repeat protein [Rhodanobacter glycinis]
MELHQFGHLGGPEISALVLPQVRSAQRYANEGPPRAALRFAGMPTEAMPAARKFILPSALSLICLLTLWAYWPGLHGSFLFDDFANLPALGATGPIEHWATFWRYITSGSADPTGRPLTLLTFLLDARNWPADPFPFKRTNLILHLGNGVLLYALLARLGRSLQIGEGRATAGAVLGAALWLLHPLMVSTTLYIVQREAMLPATCVMIGLLLWLHGRQRLAEGHALTGALWSILGLGGFTLLATLAKANGALLPAYALLIEAIVLRPRQPLPINTARMHKAIMRVFGWLPALALFAYVARTAVQGLATGGLIGIRSWSIGQRLLTEPRVLLDYLKLLWLPRPYTSGLFNDQFAASTSWLHPASTLPALLAVLALIAGAWHLRRHCPSLALAVLFYFAGQWLESTALPLELYFEHRNYTPALLMFWPLGLWLADTGKLRAVKITLMAVLPLAFADMTHARAEVWGNTRAQALIWATLNPASPRAQANAADVEMQHGHPQEAAARIARLLAAQPDQAQLAFNLIDAHCMLGGLQASDVPAARYAMRRTANVGSLFVRWFDRALPEAMAGTCRGLTTALLSDLVADGLRNPRLATAGPQQDLTFLRGRIALASGHPNAASQDFQEALSLVVRPDFALRAAAVLGAAGQPELGLQLLAQYRAEQRHVGRPGLGMAVLHAWVLARQHYWTHEIDRLDETLRQQATASATPTEPYKPSAPTLLSLKAHRP